MKTINFYSYKGGVGRTMLTAQIARLLAALAKGDKEKVVVVDFDFDAPGIPAVFGMPIGAVEKGLYELVSDCYMSERVSIIGPKSKEDNIVEIENWLAENLRQTKNLKNNNDVGNIFFLPSGKVDEYYWDSLTAPTWINFLSNDEVVESDDSITSFCDFIEYRMKPALENMGFKYLLIDSRAGISNYGKVAHKVSDIQAVMFCPNDEARHMINTGFASKYKPNNPLFIVSRMPPELDKPTQETFNDMVALIKEKFQYNDEVFKIHSDLHAHLNPEIRNIDKKFTKAEQEKKVQEGERPAEMVQMHEDILHIFSKLCLDKTKETEDIFAPWKEIYEYDFIKTYKNRLFEFQINTGEMNNPEDKTRNVAFKVETFIGLLSNFYSTLFSEFSDEGVETFKQALIKAGLHCGKKFGKEISKQWKKDGSFSAQSKENIERWCKFDSDVGFGLLSYDGNNEKGLVKIVNPFILGPEILGAQYNIEFFTGYVRGVLIDLLGMGKIKVELYGTSSGGEIGNTITYEIDME